MQSKLSTVFTFIFCILFLGLLVNGCFHSSTKHKDDPFWIQQSPLAIYRGVEYFWHDDYAGVNWKEKIDDDAETAIELIMSSNSGQNIDETKTQMRNLSEKISKYPKDKRQEIEKIVRRYLSFIFKITDDFTSYVNNFPIDSTFRMSSSTQKIIDSLKSENHITGLETMKQIFDSLSVNIKNDSENISTYRQRLKLHNLTDNEFIGKSFLRIFQVNL